MKSQVSQTHINPISPRCSALVQVSWGRDNVNSPDLSTDDTADSDNEDSVDLAAESPETNFDESPSLTLEQTFRHCRRVHLMMKTLTRAGVNLVAGPPKPAVAVHESQRWRSRGSRRFLAPESFVARPVVAGQR